MQEFFVDLYTLSTPDLIRVAHTVAAILRERLGHDTEQGVIEEDHGFREALVEAGGRGVFIGDLKAVLKHLSLS